MTKKNKHRPNINHPTSDLRARKKAAVLGSREKKTAFLLPVILAVILVAGVIGGYLAVNGRAEAPATAALPNAPQTAPATADDRVTYPVAMFADGKAKHFEYQSGEHTIRYFVIKSADGVLRAAFDACDVCWPAGKGYYQDGDDMVCRNCGRRFASHLVNDVKGGCNPAPLNRRVEGEMLVIEPADIRAGASYFNFDGKV
jgi:uncharacterized membrane protein